MGLNIFCSYTLFISFSCDANIKLPKDPIKNLITCSPVPAPLHISRYPSSLTCSQHRSSLSFHFNIMSRPKNVSLTLRWCLWVYLWKIPFPASNYQHYISCRVQHRPSDFISKSLERRQVGYIQWRNLQVLK